MSEIQLPSHTGQSHLVVISLPRLVKETLFSFSWRQKGLGAMTDEANSGLPGDTAPSLSICSSFFLTFDSCRPLFRMQCTTSWQHQHKTSGNEVYLRSYSKLVCFAIVFGLLPARAEHTCTLLISWPSHGASLMNELARKTLGSVCWLIVSLHICSPWLPSFPPPDHLRCPPKGKV